jgi:hypothetical protein
MKSVKEQTQNLDRLANILNSEKVLPYEEKKKAASLIRNFSSLVTRVNFTNFLAEKINEDEQSVKDSFLGLEKRIDYGSCRIGSNKIELNDNTFKNSSLFSSDNIFRK